METIGPVIHFRISKVGDVAELTFKKISFLVTAQIIGLEIYILLLDLL